MAGSLGVLEQVLTSHFTFAEWIESDGFGSSTLRGGFVLEPPIWLCPAATA
ncbi:hypothetical protein [Paractinoplanes brasiliensis]|uniref:hypothetical protein n=1 Tax=Paractinoplanes brasiliensis TaxID=52695 RepID=UPI0014151E0E|nr:hypothetical protein [Actinoplanes brasiliensis]